MPSKSKSRAPEKKSLRGIAISQGTARGKVRIISGPSTFKTFKKGEILITPFLTPDYASVVHKAAGVVADIGAMMSHAAVVVRELHIPCLVNTKTAAIMFQNGDIVILDTTRGIVEVE